MSSTFESHFRFQGTDGVRAKVALSSDPDIAGLSPVEAFIERDRISEEFVELYLYARLELLTRAGVFDRGDRVVIGWDGRDGGAPFFAAALKGAAKRGAQVVSVGVAPTPLIPFYARHIGAMAGFMITASHNPVEYNGIKTFTGPTGGLKLLPEDDHALSELILELDYEPIRSMEPQTAPLDRTSESAELFIESRLDPANSLLEPSDEALKKIELIVDSANGALARIARKVFDRFDFARKTYLHDGDGVINDNCGAAHFDSPRFLSAAQITRLYPDNTTINHLLSEGRDASGRKQITLALLFDGDGDRLSAAIYDRRSDGALVLGGTRIGLEIAELIRSKSPPDRAEAVAVHTIESDIGATRELARLKFKERQSVVGDKWIIREAILQTLSGVGAPIGAQTLSADALEKKLIETRSARAPFIGWEESGHIVTPLVFDGKLFFAGDALKAALNLLAALIRHIDSDREEIALEKILDRFDFSENLHESIYIHDVDRTRWTRSSDIWRAARTIATENSNLDFVERIFDEEPDMLYLACSGRAGARGAIFIRLSGTENKIGINLRASGELIAPFERIGAALREELRELKLDRK